MVADTKGPINTFISYSKKDQRFKDDLVNYLKILQRQGIIALFDEKNISLGVDVQEESKKQLEIANLILVLISADYLASDYLYQVEATRALEKHANAEATVIPIIVRPVPWQDTPFGNIQALPSNGKPTSSWDSRADALNDIANGIKRAIDDMLKLSNPLSQNPPSPATPSKGKRSVTKTQQVPQTNLAQAQPPPISTNTTQATQPVTPVSKRAAPDAMKATADKPIRSITEDKLGFSIWVTALRNFIKSPDTTTPLTISIEGPWGSGKSSFMYMLKDLLEPSFSFWERMNKVTLLWLMWFIKFVITLPVWIFGKLLVRVGSSRNGVRSLWYQAISDGLSYDPELDEDTDLSTLTKRELFWSRIAAYHCPMQPITHPTVWFNAWKFDQEEQLWAALALAVLDQIKKKYNLPERIWFWFRLMLKRLSPLNAVFQLFLKVILPIFLGVLAWNFDTALKLAVGTYHGNLKGFGAFLPLSQTFLWIGAILIGVIQISSIIKDPFQIPIKKVFDKPNYKEKVGFIGSFEDDFTSIVSTITKPRFGWKSRKLIIFIDDLDRCKLPKAVDIIEGINLFLDSEQCIFVIGMDATAVIASIETKYTALFDQIRHERGDVTSVGRLFLDKIIQVPINIPSSTEVGVGNLIRAITERRFRPLQTRKATINGNTSSALLSMTNLTRPINNQVIQKRTKKSITKKSTQPLPMPIVDKASYSHEEVGKAILLGAYLLPGNPREIKRFVNLFRLYIYIVNAQGLFEEELHTGLTMNRLAVWVAWSIRWSDIVKYLSAEAHLSESTLVVFLGNIATELETDGSWVKPSPDPSGAETDSPITKLNGIVRNIRQGRNNNISHWSELPWELWLLDPDFLKCIKELESFWNQSQHSNTNWLHSMLLMTKITFTTTSDQTSSLTTAATTIQS